MAWLSNLGFRTTVLCYLTLHLQFAVTVGSHYHPSFQKMSKGVDITALDILPPDMQSDDGYRESVFDLTYDSVKPLTTLGNEEYMTPDQVNVTIDHMGSLNLRTSLYKTYSDVRHTMANTVTKSGSVDLWNFAFSHSKSYTEMQETIVEDSKYISDVSSVVNRFDVTFPSHIRKLGGAAQAFLDSKITGNFTTNPEAYKEFIKIYGTHFFERANFGGYIREIYKTSTDYFYSKSDDQVEEMAEADFSALLARLGVQVSSFTSVDALFTQVTTAIKIYYGGDHNILDSNGTTLWQPTVDANPWLLSGQLLPISDLITNQIKKDSMVQAVSSHVLQSYLEELNRLINYAKTKWLDGILTTLESKITALENNKLLNATEVKNLGAAVEREVIVPSWFTTQTQLCYIWRADGDSAQCGGGAVNKLCARPNTMTPAYRDDTDHRRGGCRMQWGIQSSGFPEWFNQIQVCYRWEADGDAGQCGGMTFNSVCANINQYTSEYRDDSDSRGGGCKMSWKLHVPSDAPLWLRSTKLCFSWFPDGDVNQCGGISERELCAKANEWTQYYRDDTDRRGGGCTMSWGLQLDI